MSKYIVHAYVGGNTTDQTRCYCGAKRTLLALYGSRLTFKEMDKDTARSNCWNERDVFEWLASADIPLVICHMHQGALDLWQPLDIQDMIGRFSEMNGFPSRSHVTCPIFLQDKFRYIEAIPDLCNATLRVYLTLGNQYKRETDHITS
jgi:hypothetical protein